MFPEHLYLDLVANGPMYFWLIYSMQTLHIIFSQAGEEYVLFFLGTQVAGIGNTGGRRC